jgi:hypothetical protein
MIYIVIIVVVVYVVVDVVPLPLPPNMPISLRRTGFWSLNLN